MIKRLRFWVSGARSRRLAFAPLAPSPFYFFLKNLKKTRWFSIGEPLRTPGLGFLRALSGDRSIEVRISLPPLSLSSFYVLSVTTLAFLLNIRLRSLIHFCRQVLCWRLGKYMRAFTCLLCDFPFLALMFWLHHYFLQKQAFLIFFPFLLLMLWVHL